jgi:hypothetical protein
MSPFLHSWLTATQYIAPLMANFDTRKGNGSDILYKDYSKSKLSSINEPDITGRPIIFSIIVNSLIITISLCEIKDNMSKLSII